MKRCIFQNSSGNRATECTRKLNYYLHYTSAANILRHRQTHQNLRLELGEMVSSTDWQLKGNPTAAAANSSDLGEIIITVASQMGNV